jgi:hypothetical protein
VRTARKAHANKCGAGGGGASRVCAAQGRADSALGSRVRRAGGEPATRKRGLRALNRRDLTHAEAFTPSSVRIRAA